MLNKGVLTNACIRFNAINQEQLAVGAPAPQIIVQKRFASTEHSHSGLWAAEKYLSAALLAVIPAAFIVPMAPLEYLLALSLVTHIHWGVEAIVVDYIRPSIFGAVIPKASIITLYALSMLALGGLCYFNYTDIGISHAIRMMMTKV
ncbi:succinate dehydrogenase [ubiquinone] cytochrome b small subunit-like protein [Leptotrombidium deliense]|uniref:Succinate dehydrogenase [ubiquinone] cytochrome b small subunit n=1 Tax=Leptotrombidium deliense TaxID=299467 RepID=A0A443SHS6_9ACAR|nr:succinate dehydrogenase [ubiquinone] cytochrome b small subunit-like protein [Leptotrombidium deliense]